VNPWLLFPSALVLSVLLTGALRRYASACRLLDIPNERSSHAVPTPRGGGVAIVITFLAGLAALVSSQRLEVSLAVALGGAGALVGIVGFIDDHKHLPSRWRLLAHFAAVIWALAWMGGFPPIHVMGESRNLGWLGHALAAIGLVWLLNLYNFMDGIDGIAGLEAVTTGLGASALLILQSPAREDWPLPALLAMASLGFLVWNWPPARIFMGDAGSGFVGLMLGLLAVRSAPTLLWSWAILLGVFVVDATLTLARRVQRGEKSYEAHRSHAYQQAARQYGHQPVTVTVGAINLFWLLPMAATVALGALDGLVGTLVAYAPLVWLGGWYKAGVPAADTSATR